MTASGENFFAGCCQYGKSAKFENTDASFTVLPKVVRSGEIAPFAGVMCQHNTVDNPVETVHNFDFARLFSVYSAVMFWRNEKLFSPFPLIVPSDVRKSEKMVLPLVIVVKSVYNIQNFVL